MPRFGHHRYRGADDDFLCGWLAGGVGHAARNLPSLREVDGKRRPAALASVAGAIRSSSCPIDGRKFA